MFYSLEFYYFLKRRRLYEKENASKFQNFYNFLFVQGKTFLVKKQLSLKPSALSSSKVKKRYLLRKTKL